MGALLLELNSFPNLHTLTRRPPAVEEEQRPAAARATSPDVPKKRLRTAAAAAPVSPRGAGPASPKAATQPVVSPPPAARRAGVKSPEPARKPAAAPAAAAAAKPTPPAAAASPAAAPALIKPAPLPSPPLSAGKKPVAVPQIPEAHKPLKKARSQKHDVARDLAHLQPTLLLIALLVGLAFGARLYLQSNQNGSHASVAAQVSSAGAAAVGLARSASVRASDAAQAAALRAADAAQAAALRAADAARGAGARATAAAAAAGGVGWQALSDARELYQTLYDSARNGIEATVAGATGQAAQAQPGWEASEIAALLPEGSAWQRTAAAVADRLRRGGKSTVLLLGCGTAADCAAAADALAALRGVPAGCSLRVEGFELAAAANTGAGGPAAAAQLQAALKPFAGRCPSGLVVLRDAQLLPPDMLPALHGASSGARGPAIALLAQLPSPADARAAALGEPSEVDTRLRATVLDEGLGVAVSHLPDQERATKVLAPVLRALQRRVDFAVPLRLGREAAEEAEAQVHAEAAAAA